MLKRIPLYTILSILLILSSVAARELPVLSGIGGDFSAVSSAGETIQFSQFRGRVVLLAFGYTNCADICPFTLGYLKSVYQQLTPTQKQQTQVVFVTIDPSYDTPEHLKAYLSHFHADFIGLTGSRAQIDRIVSLYQAKYQSLADAPLPTKHVRRPVQKEGVNNDHDTTTLYSHSLQIFLVDQRGYTRGMAFTGTPQDQLITNLQVLMSELNP